MIGHIVCLCLGALGGFALCAALSITRIAELEHTVQALHNLIEYQRGETHV